MNKKTSTIIFEKSLLNIVYGIVFAIGFLSGYLQSIVQIVGFRPNLFK